MSKALAILLSAASRPSSPSTLHDMFISKRSPSYRSQSPTTTISNTQNDRYTPSSPVLQVNTSAAKSRTLDKTPRPTLPQQQIQVIDNPRFGVVHHLRTLSLHAVVLFLGVVLAQLGWGEFVYWGKGPIGQVLLSQSQASTQTVLCDSFSAFSADDYDVSGGYDGYGGGGLGNGECSIGGSGFGDLTMAATDPER